MRSVYVHDFKVTCCTFVNVHAGTARLIKPYIHYYNTNMDAHHEYN